MPEPKAIGLTALLIPPPTWRTRREATRWLREDLPRWLSAIEDLAVLGIVSDPALAMDLGNATRAAVAYLERPRPIDVDDQRAEPGAVAALARMLEQLDERTNPETLGSTAADLHHQVLPSTVALLHGALADAARVYRRERSRQQRVGVARQRRADRLHVREHELRRQREHELRRAGEPGFR
jgi:hypothetical protein